MECPESLSDLADPRITGRLSGQELLQAIKALSVRELSDLSSILEERVQKIKAQLEIDDDGLSDERATDEWRKRTLLARRWHIARHKVVVSELQMRIHKTKHHVAAKEAERQRAGHEAKLERLAHAKEAAEAYAKLIDIRRAAFIKAAKELLDLDTFKEIWATAKEMNPDAFRESEEIQEDIDRAKLSSLEEVT